MYKNILQLVFTTSIDVIVLQRGTNLNRKLKELFRLYNILDPKTYFIERIQ